MPYLPDRPVDERASLRALEAGGLPFRAQRRLAELATPGHQVFSSTLTPAESVVARATGLSPISQVMGASVMHVGWSAQSTMTASGYELISLTVAHETARRRALARMLEEAKLLRAHVVVGVKYVERPLEWGEELVEVMVTGTAMRVAGFPDTDAPPLTLLDADELWKLHQAGYWPVAIAMGNCYWFEPHCDCQADGSIFSGPLPMHTNAVRQARALATERFRGFAAHFHAAGVVGVKVRRHAHGHHHDGHSRFHVEILLLGTAVVRRGTAEPPHKPMIVMDLAGVPGRKAQLAERRRKILRRHRP